MLPLKSRICRIEGSTSVQLSGLCFSQSERPLTIDLAGNRVDSFWYESIVRARRTHSAEQHRRGAERALRSMVPSKIATREYGKEGRLVQHGLETHEVLCLSDDPICSERTGKR